MGGGSARCISAPECVVWWLYSFTYGNAAVCPPVSPCKGASIVHLRVQCVYFWYGNAATRTFGRAHRYCPYAFCLRELRADVRPYGFVWWIARGRLAPFGWIVCKWLFCLCGIVWKNITEIGRGGACVPARVAPQGRIHR